MKKIMEKWRARKSKKEEERPLTKPGYVRLREIGSGSYAEVFLERKNKKRRVAKVFYPVSRSSTTVTMEDEVNMLSQLSHPNIIKYLGQSLEPQKTIYFEYAQHGNLHKYIETEERIRWKSFGYRCVYQITSALAYLHGLGIVHRDVKPDNVLLMGDYTAKLCDFGYAVKLSEMDRREFRGTTMFIAPEVINGKKYGLKVDCYSLGITLYEMSSRSDAWAGKNVKGIYKAVKNGEVQTLPDKTPRLIKNIYQGCTLFSPKERPTTAEICSQLLAYSEKHPKVKGISG